MKLLLDTQCLLWWFSEPDRLNTAAFNSIASESNEIWLSVASIWELAIKVASGKLSLPEPIDTYLAKHFVHLKAKPLGITASHALRAASLPPHHKDPFDRLLIAQAQTEGITIATTDLTFHKYAGTPILWAGK
jgi:PIN domain nuclease of toxin-antitoxin system